jgi:hypothetical protein
MHYGMVTRTDSYHEWKITHSDDSRPISLDNNKLTPVLTNNGPSTVPETRSGGTRIGLQHQPFVESEKLNVTGLAGSKEEE